MSFPQPLRAVVTGAGSGLGRALSLDLAKRGASLIVSDIDRSSAEETAQLVRQRQAEAEVIPCDVTDRDAVFALVDETERRLGASTSLPTTPASQSPDPSMRSRSRTGAGWWTSIFGV
jgi:NAD(P)-dependent dehydrogenase (short-subunit alcohol dehydrogenase family)